jgi:hypothetical protein
MACCRDVPKSLRGLGAVHGRLRAACCSILLP